MKSSSLAVAFLVFVNLIPIFGVLFLGWNLFNMMILYWMENVIIGFFNTIKMAFVSKNDRSMLASIGEKMFMIPFFAVHYGLFCYGHRFFIVSLFGGGDIFGNSSFGSSFLIGGFRSPFEFIFSIPFSLGTTFSWAVLSMVLSHGLSLVLNYFGQKEYKKVTLDEQMFQPYQRIMILHVTILFGGFVTMYLGEPVLALVFMGVLKIVLDVMAHLKEHKKARERVLNTN